MLNYIKLVKQIRRDYLHKKSKDYYRQGDLTARRVLENEIDEYEIDGTFLEDAVYHNILYEVTNDKEEFFLFVTIDEYDFIANYIL